MEYRRRRRVGHGNTRHSGTSTAYVAVFIVFFGIVYLLSASKIGTWVANNWIAPALSRTDATLSKPTGATPAPTPETVIVQELEQTFTLPESTFHAIQIGVYAERANADAQSAALRAVGAAGYVLPDGDRFRVLASAYPDVLSAQTVSAQLLEAEIESRLHTLSRGEKKLTSTGTQQQLAVLGDAIDGVDPLLGALYDACIAFDKEKQSVADGIAAIVLLQSRAERVCTELAALPAEPSEGLAQIKAFYESVLEQTSVLAQAEEREQAAFSAGLKHMYLTALMTLM